MVDRACRARRRGGGRGRVLRTRLRSRSGARWGGLDDGYDPVAEEMVSAVLGILPLLVVFLVFERQIVQGIANTGIK